MYVGMQGGRSLYNNRIVIHMLLPRTVKTSETTLKVQYAGKGRG